MHKGEKDLSSTPSALAHPSKELSRSLVWIMAFACGLGVANPNYIQPLLALIAHDFAVSDGSVGFLATLTQMGYAFGLLFIAPLGDTMSRRRLVLAMVLAVIVSLAAIALAPSFAFLAVSILVMGFVTAFPQLLIPYASSLAQPQERGRIVGTVMGGVLTGLLLARTVSGFVAAHWGWRSLYWIAGGTMLLLLVLLYVRLPHEEQRGKMSYPYLLRSLWSLVVQEPVLREASFFGVLSFASFQLFWVTVTFFLSSFYHRFIEFPWSKHDADEHQPCNERDQHRLDPTWDRKEKEHFSLIVFARLSVPSRTHECAKGGFLVSRGYPPTTPQSVFPVADQRFSVCGVCCLRRVCALNRRTPLTGESERILPQPGHSTRLIPLSVNRWRSMRTTPENVQLAVLFVSSCSFAVSTVSTVVLQEIRRKPDEHEVSVLVQFILLFQRAC